MGGIPGGRVEGRIWRSWAAHRHCCRPGRVHRLFGLRNSYPYQLKTRYQAGVDGIEAIRGIFGEIGGRRR